MRGMHPRHLAAAVLFAFLAFGILGCQAVSAESWPASQDSRVRFYYFGSPG